MWNTHILVKWDDIYSKSSLEGEEKNHRGQSEDAHGLRKGLSRRVIFDHLHFISVHVKKWPS